MRRTITEETFRALGFVTRSPETREKNAEHLKATLSQFIGNQKAIKIES